MTAASPRATGGTPRQGPPSARGPVVRIVGAEAAIEEGTWLGRDVLIKHRIAKSYRHPGLDARIRAERTRDEAHLLVAARRAGVRVPVVHDIDRGAARIVMEAVTGQPLRQVLPDDSAEDAMSRMQQLGAMVGALHDAGLTHGDLTTSNVMVSATGEMVLIDFGLGQFTREDEPRGVDLHLVEEALEATDDRAEALMAAFLDGYGQADCAAGAVRRLADIRLRGRYREAV